MKEQSEQDIDREIEGIFRTIRKVIEITEEGYSTMNLESKKMAMDLWQKIAGAFFGVIVLEEEAYSAKVISLALDEISKNN
jgi:hypothetical protein